MKSKLKNYVAVGKVAKKALPILLVDECCNNSLIDKLAKDLMNLGLISATCAVWQKAMVKPDGTTYLVTGNPSDSQIENGDKQLKSHSFPDDFVSDLVFAHTTTEDVVFITENTRLDKFGVRKLLQSKAEKCQGEYALLAFYKKGKTTYEKFIIQVIERIQSWDKNVTFQEQLI